MTEPEPIATDDPLLTLENVAIAPHIASGSVETRSQLAEIAARNLLAGLGILDGPPPAPVNPDVLQRR